jgi:hypothetical protein
MPDRATDPALAFLGGYFLARAVTPPIPPAELALAPEERAAKAISTPRDDKVKTNAQK